MDIPRDLDVTAAFVGDLTLTFGDSKYTIAGDFDIDTMIAFLAIEQRVQNSEETQELLTALADARTLIQQLVNERYPDAVLPKLSPRQVNRALAWLISGGENTIVTAAAEVQDALVSGVDLQAALEGRDVGEGVQIGEEPGSEEGPLVSASSSDERSSTSETTTDGDRSGGEESRGASSGSTSTQLTAG